MAVKIGHRVVLSSTLKKENMQNSTSERAIHMDMRNESRLAAILPKRLLIRTTATTNIAPTNDKQFTTKDQWLMISKSAEVISVLYLMADSTGSSIILVKW
ncbi:hypothetical protein DSO57_1021290 [Entomophthora muscae]|uniref:Uncharacterized protein n=1 Tax=Entomophthora muscae TaxID=34485 RepID=A0ACC2RUG9_9FUNG|nr:hypothetical protein DSO57_1021290 [Entomophthora muscae]